MKIFATQRGYDIGIVTINEKNDIGLWCLRSEHRVNKVFGPSDLLALGKGNPLAMAPEVTRDLQDALQLSLQDAFLPPYRPALTTRIRP